MPASFMASSFARSRPPTALFKSASSTPRPLALTRNRSPSTTVNSELPPGFTAALQAKGVTYAGLSPVASGTVDEVLAHAPADAAAPSGVDPIVLRTSFSDSAQDASFQDRAALMVVVPQSASQSAAQGSGSVYVAFLDPTTYQVLTTLTYSGAAASG